MRAVDLTGQRFGRLTVRELAGARGAFRYWRVRCDCGWELEIRGLSLTGGRSTSCGCRRREVSRARLQRHGHASHRARTPTYLTWRAMINRCENPEHERFQHYGGRGIKVCERWRGSFEMFLADMGERPDGFTIDRINVDGNYEPANCKWSTSKEQRANQRPGRVSA